MAASGQVRVSLFPFMSVLACTIGALMLLLVAMSLSALGASDASIRAYAETRELAVADREALERERARIERAEALWSEVDEALVARGLESGLSRSSIERALALEAREQDVRARLAALEAEEQEIDDDRETIETTIEVLRSRRETLPILIDATGLSRHLEPYFVECDAEGITAYRASDDFSYFVSNADLSTSGDFDRYLRRVAASPGALLVLLVRPDGIPTMLRAEIIARRAGIRVARLPLPGQGEIDWSLVRRTAREGR